MRVSSKASQSDIDKLSSEVLFQEQSEDDKRVEAEQRELEKSGNGFRALVSTPREPITATEAEAMCEQMLAVHERNAKLSF